MQTTIYLQSTTVFGTQRTVCIVVLTEMEFVPHVPSMYNVKLVLTLHVKYDVWHLFKKACMEF